MTPEQALEAIGRGLMQGALAHSQPVPRPHRKKPGRKPQPPIEGRTIAQPQDEPTLPLGFDGNPIPPVITAKMLDEMDRTLQGLSPAGTRIPGEGDAQGGARL